MFPSLSLCRSAHYTQVLQLTQGQRFPQQTAETIMDLLEQQQQQQHSGNIGGSANGLSAGANGTGAGGHATSDAAAAAQADEEEEEEEEEGELMEPPEQLLQMLDITSRLPGSTGTATDGQQDADSAAAAAASTASAAAAQQRSHQQVVQQLGGVLKGVTNSAACGAAVWGLLGRWYALQGELVSSQEARLKQVRIWPRVRSSR